MGAKTGSAQVTGQENANGLFVCFAPYDDPEIAICVAVEEGGSGAATAVIAARMLEAYFGIESEKTQDGTAQTDDVQQDGAEQDAAGQEEGEDGGRNTGGTGDTQDGRDNGAQNLSLIHI